MIQRNIEWTVSETDRGECRRRWWRATLDACIGQYPTQGHVVRPASQLALALSLLLYDASQTAVCRATWTSCSCLQEQGWAWSQSTPVQVHPPMHSMTVQFHEPHIWWRTSQEHQQLYAQFTHKYLPHLTSI